MTLLLRDCLLGTKQRKLLLSSGWVQQERMSEECKCACFYASLQLIPSYAVPASLSLFLESPRAEAPESSWVVCADLAVLRARRSISVLVKSAVTL